MVERFDRRRAGGFTITEVVVVAAILVVLIAILMPNLTRAREQGRRALCASNVRQIANAAIMWACQDKQTVYANGGGTNPYTVKGFYPAGAAIRSSGNTNNGWDTSRFATLRAGGAAGGNGVMANGLYFVYEAGFLQDQKVAYCPSESNPQWQQTDVRTDRPYDWSSWTTALGNQPNVEGYQQGVPAGYTTFTRGASDSGGTGPNWGFSLYGVPPSGFGPRYLQPLKMDTLGTVSVPFLNKAFWADHFTHAGNLNSRHVTGVNVGYGDGTVAWVSRDLFNTLLPVDYTTAKANFTSTRTSFDTIWSLLDK